MYKRHTGQVSMLENPEFFGSLPLDPNNDWIKLSRLVPWDEFDQMYRKNFRAKSGQPACDSRMALGAMLIKVGYKGMSDEDITREIAMNPYLQFFLGLQEYRYQCPFDASMMTRFRQRITPEMIAWVNDRVIERGKQTDDEPKDPKDDEPQDPPADNGNGLKSAEAESNEGTMILDATCVPQAIRFPTDASLLNEAREKTEAIIDILHANRLTDGQKPRTYREEARKQYNGFSKSRKKTAKMIRTTIRKQLGYLRRNLSHIDAIVSRHPGCLESCLSGYQRMQLGAIRLLLRQQEEMYTRRTHRVDGRIVSLSQPWVRPIVRGKATAPVEFGAKVEMSVVDGFLRIEDLRWDAFNEGTTLQASAERYKRDYGHYPARILADTIFRTRENRRFCAEHGIHLNGPKLGKPSSDECERKRQKRLEWLESGERGEIERQFGVGKRRYTLGSIVTKLKETSEVSIHAAVLFMNLRKRLRLLLRFFWEWLLWAAEWVGDAVDLASQTVDLAC